MSLNKEQKKELLIALFITFLLAGFGYCSNEDYKQEKRSENELCAYEESIGATETDLYLDVCSKPNVQI